MKHGCDNCKYRFFPATRSPCDNCIRSGDKYSEWTAQTNADRIRSMTDEEMADEILRWFNWLNAVDWQSDRIINWLKEEVKE